MNLRRVDFDENTPAPIGRKNAKKVAQAVAKAGEKLYNIKIDPGLIYGQWVKESGPDLNANPPLNNEAHNLGGLSGTPPAWLAKQGVTTGSKHAEDSGIYMNFPNYKLYGEAYIHRDLVHCGRSSDHRCRVHSGYRKYTGVRRRIY